MSAPKPGTRCGCNDADCRSVHPPVFGRYTAFCHCRRKATKFDVEIGTDGYRYLPLCGPCYESSVAKAGQP